MQVALARRAGLRIYARVSQANRVDDVFVLALPQSRVVDDVSDQDFGIKRGVAGEP